MPGPASQCWQRGHTSPTQCSRVWEHRDSARAGTGNGLAFDVRLPVYLSCLEGVTPAYSYSNNAIETSTSTVLKTAVVHSYLLLTSVLASSHFSLPFFLDS